MTSTTSVDDPWPLPDRAGFAAWAAKATSAAKDAPPPDSKGGNADLMELFEQQRFCRAYLDHRGPHRGLLLYHGLGSGKSCSAIATAEALRAAKGRHVYVLLPASLRNNYVREVRRCGGRMFAESQDWRLVTRPSTPDRAS